MRAMALGSLARLRFASLRAERALPGSCKNRIGADQAKPAFEILPVLSQPRGEPIDHGANGAHAVRIGHRLDFCRQVHCCVARRRLRAPQSVSAARAPRARPRALRRSSLLQISAAPALSPACSAASPRKKRGFAAEGSFASGGFERLLGFRRHDAMGGIHQGLPIESRAAPGSRPSRRSAARAARTASSGAPIRK